MSSSSTLLTRVDHFIQGHELLRPGQRVVVGVSGGVDSMVLAHGLHRLGYAVVGVHVNYGLRGEASDADEEFVRRWGESLDPPVPLHVERVDPKAAARASGASVQEVARQQRYAFMARCAAACDTDRVAVGHHRDDQAETLLLNLFRGSGLEGLGGMAPRRPMECGPDVTLVRPLLGVTRASIEAYAKAHGVEWRSDASNETLTYDRNTIRHRILPVIESQFSGATDRIAGAAGRVRAYLAHTFEPELEARFTRCTAEAAWGGALVVTALHNEPSIWRRRLVLEALQRWFGDAPYTAAVAQEIDALLDAQVGRRVEVGAGTIWRERDVLRFVPAGAEPIPVEAQPIPMESSVELPQGTLRVDVLDDVPDQLDAGAPHTVYVDNEALSGELTVRTWQAGDRFQPLGMRHSKLVSDFLTDEQVPPHERAGVLVLCDDTRIVWVVGHRIAHPVRIRPGTERVVQLSFQPAVVDPS